MHVISKQLASVIKDEYARLGYVFFEEGDHNLNIFGIRRKTTEHNQETVFDDVIGVVYKTGGRWRTKIWRGTTDPGKTQKKVNAKGKAKLIPGQHKGIWQIGTHKGYAALSQIGAPVSVYRLQAKDEFQLVETTPVDRGWFGINLHRAARDKVLEDVKDYSAGCQVLQLRGDFLELMHLARTQVELNPKWTKFSYTLFTLEEDPVSRVSPSTPIAYLANLA